MTSATFNAIQTVLAGLNRPRTEGGRYDTHRSRDGGNVFEKHHQKKLADQYQHELGHWQELHDSTAEALALAQGFNGESTAQLMLKAGEAVYATVTNAALVEERRGAGHYTGASSGVSIPIGSLGGHAVRYHVGATRGHYVQAPPVPTAIDHGTVFVTNQRVVFQGRRQTRECAFAKLIGFQHTNDGGTIFSVSNRQKPTVIHYGTQIAGWFDFRLDLALAHFKGTVPDLLQQLQDQMAKLDAARPQPPVPTA